MAQVNQVRGIEHKTLWGANPSLMPMTHCTSFFFWKVNLKIKELFEKKNCVYICSIQKREGGRGELILRYLLGVARHHTILLSLAPTNDGESFVHNAVFFDPQIPSCFFQVLLKSFGPTKACEKHDSDNY